MELVKNENTFTFKSENRSIELTGTELSFLMNQFSKYNLRESIEYFVREMDGDTISIEKSPYGFNDFVGEIYTDLEDEIDYGNFPSDEDIQDKITDTADYYDMCID